MNPDQIKSAQLLDAIRAGNQFSRGVQATQPKTDGQFIVGSLRADKSLSFSDRPVIHLTEDVARTEVARLAKANPGKEYVYLRVLGAAKAQDVVWANL